MGISRKGRRGGRFLLVVLYILEPRQRFRRRLPAPRQTHPSPRQLLRLDAIRRHPAHNRAVFARHGPADAQRIAAAQASADVAGPADEPLHDVDAAAPLVTPLYFLPLASVPEQA